MALIEEIWRNLKILELIFSIFRKPDDWISWDCHLEYAAKTKDISEEIRKDLFSAIQFFKEEFGNDFFKKTDKNHPLRSKITDKSPWRFEDLIRFTATLKELKEKSIHYVKLKEKLLGTTDSRSEGIPFFEISASYLHVGCTVEFIEEVRNEKNPDLRIKFPQTGEVLYIEVSRINDSELSEKLTDNFEVITSFMLFECPLIPHAGMQLQLIPDEHMPSVLTAIRRCTQEAAETPKTLIAYTDDYVNMRFENSEDIQQLEKWCMENNVRRGFHVPVNYDETFRISNYKISQKVKKLPLDASGIIYFPCSPFYFMAINVELAIHIFNLRMKDFPNLVGFVFTSETIDPQESSNFRIGKHFFGIKMMNRVLARKLLFVYNERYSGILTTHAMNTIYNSFI